MMLIVIVCNVAIAQFEFDNSIVAEVSDAVILFEACTVVVEKLIAGMIASKTVRRLQVCSYSA